jgi:predicted protein tyrosine phosphatase
MEKKIPEQIEERLGFLAEANMFNHVVSFAFFCDRQARRYAAEAATWVANYTPRAAVYAAADAADQATAVAAARAAEDATGAAEVAEVAARREQLEFLEWIWITTKQHTRRKISLKNGFAIVL